MKTQHTPGPWKYRRLDGITGLIAEDGTVLARINTPCNNERTGKANACLIAAAPELLEALESLLDWAECQCGLSGNDECYGCCEDEELAGARAAIRKAKGE